MNRFTDRSLRDILFVVFVLSIVTNAQCLAQSSKSKVMICLDGMISKGNPHIIGSDEQVLEIKKLQFYLACSKREIPATAEYHLVNLSGGCDTLEPGLDEGAQWYAGIDSITQQDGAREGDLDPFNGMYWAWHSGYIQLKLEALLRMKNGEQHEIILHAGGFAGGYQPLIALSGIRQKKQSSFYVDLSTFITLITEKQIYKSMSPGPQSRMLMQAFSKCIKEK